MLLCSKASPCLCVRIGRAWLCQPARVIVRSLSSVSLRRKPTRSLSGAGQRRQRTTRGRSSLLVMLPRDPYAGNPAPWQDLRSFPVTCDRSASTFPSERSREILPERGGSSGARVRTHLSPGREALLRLVHHTSRTRVDRDVVADRQGTADAEKFDGLVASATLSRPA